MTARGMRIVPTPVAAAKVFERLGYSPWSPSVEQVRGWQIITRSGVVIAGRWTSRSVYWRTRVLAKTLGLTLASLVRRGARRLPPDRSYAIIHSLWTAGYYHWVTESLPRALATHKRFPGAVPLLPQEAYEPYAPSLTALGLPAPHWYPDGRNVVVRDPVLSDCPRMFGRTDPAILREVRSRVVCSLAPDARAPWRIVYVSRAKARSRRVLNEAQVVAALGTLGAHVVHFEELDFADQVRLLAETRLLVSIHGAGLTNMLWMPHGGEVIEIIAKRHGLPDWNPVRRSFRHDACYVRLADACGHRYDCLLSPSDAPRTRSTWNANVTVNVAALRSLVEEALAR